MLHPRAALAFTVLAALGGCRGCLDGPEPVIPPEDHVDVFTQKGAARVDVLWMIDNSGSMAAEQDKIAARFREFFQRLIESEVDYHIGVVTSDPAEGGVLRAYDGPAVEGCDGCRFLTSAVPCDAPDTCLAQDVFAELVRVGIDGSAFEEGFPAVASAIGADVVDPATGAPAGEGPEENAGFLRDDASLYVVFVSDEDEGAGADGTEVRYWQRLFEGLKGTGNENKVAVAAIAGYPDDPALPPAAEVCDVLATTFDADAGNDDPRAAGLLEALRNDEVGCVDADAEPDDANAQARTGGRYIELACRTGGVVANLCEGDYTDALDALGANAAGLARKFTLSHDLATIEWGADCQPDTLDDVRLDCDDDGSFDGARDGPLCVTATALDEDAPRLVPRDDASGWTLEGATSSIRFAGAFLPAPGSDVTVRYRLRPRGCVR